METHWAPREIFDSPIVQRSKQEKTIFGSCSSHTYDLQLNNKHLAQINGCTGDNIIEKSGKVSRQSGHMFCGKPVAKCYLVEAIVFESEISYPKDINFGPPTLIPKQLYCNIIKLILFLKVKILRERRLRYTQITLGKGG